MLSSSPDLPQKSLQIKKDDKFFSRLVSKESSIANPSFRVYYGGVSGAVPFLWESQPGTPKHALCDTSLPPLTPPPSYYSHPFELPTKKHSRSKLLHTFFFKINLKKKPHLSLSPSSRSTSHSSMFVPTTPSKFQRRSRFSSASSSFDDKVVDHNEEVSVGSPTSTLCFGGGGGGRDNGGGVRVAYSTVIMKKALQAMAGRRSS